MGRLEGGTALSAAALAFGLLGGCGQDTGYLYEKEAIQIEAQPGVQPAFDLTESLYTSLTWYQQCPTDRIALPTPTRNQIIIEDAGPHDVIREKMSGVPVVIKGKVCAPRTYDRDVVILVDVSGSGLITDPLVNGTCKRGEALKTLLTDLFSVANTHVGLATSEEVVAATTTTLLDSKAALLADLGAANDDELVKFACGALPVGTGGPADFNVGFDRVKTLLGMGRGNETTKEMIFMADGFGNGTIPQIQAKQIATEITTQGIDINGEKILASIATLFVSSNVPGSGTGSFVHQFATKDRAGVALSGDVQAVQQVVAQIGTIALNSITGNQVRYRPIGATAWTTVDAMPHMTGQDFAIPSFAFDINLQQTGQEIEGEYWDTHNNRVKYSGKINWAD